MARHVYVSDKDISKKKKNILFFNEDVGRIRSLITRNLRQHKLVSLFVEMLQGVSCALLKGNVISAGKRTNYQNANRKRIKGHPLPLPRLSLPSCLSLLFSSSVSPLSPFVSLVNTSVPCRRDRRCRRRWYSFRELTSTISKIETLIKGYFVCNRGRK